MPRTLFILVALALLLAACNLNTVEPAPPTQIGQVITPPPLPTQGATFTPRPQPTTPPTATTRPGGSTGCTPRADWTVRYTVVAGDTTSSLAARTNSTVSDIAAGNCLANANTINVGQTLRLPRAPQSAPPPTLAPPPTSLPGSPAGYLSLSSIISGDAGFVALLRGDTVTIQWNNPPPNMWRAFFQLESTDGSVITPIGEDANPADGVTLVWTVPAGLTGEKLTAYARYWESMIYIFSAPVNVSSAPPSGQSCEITAAQGHTLAAYNQPDANSGLFLNAVSGEYFEVMGRTVAGWYAIDAHGIPNVPPLQRLKYVPSQSVLYGRGPCAGIPPEPQPGQMATFTNSIAGIAIDYPMGWAAVMQGNIITLSDTNGNAFEVLFAEAGQTSPPQDEAAECKSLPVCIGNRSVTSESTITLPSGIIGYRLDLSGDPVKGLGPAVYTFTIISNRNMVLRGFGDLSIYNTILNTVRPA